VICTTGDPRIQQQQLGIAKMPMIIEATARGCTLGPPPYPPGGP
jgi:hypothetical protein